MWVICYTNENNVNEWELIDGEDAMQERVYDLSEKLNIDPEDILVFDTENAI